MESLYYILAFVLGLIADVVVHYLKKVIDRILEVKETKRQRKDDLVRWLFSMYSSWKTMRDLSGTVDVVSDIVNYVKEANGYLAGFLVYAGMREKRICWEIQRLLGELGKVVLSKPLDKNKVDEIMEDIYKTAEKL